MRILKLILLSITVLVLNIDAFGIPVYYHYCGGELESVDAFLKSGGCCGEEEEEEETSDCCENDVRIFSQSFEFSVNKEINKLPSQINLIQHLFNVVFDSKLGTLSSTNSFNKCFSENNSPPPYGKKLLHEISLLTI